jgi:hypothetical protein
MKGIYYLYEVPSYFKAEDRKEYFQTSGRREKAVLFARGRFKGGRAVSKSMAELFTLG